MQMRSAHGPLTHIMVKRQFKLSTLLKFERLLSFIESEHAGFRCGSLFLVQKDIILELFFSIIMNTILMYSMVYFLFYVPT